MPAPVIRFAFRITQGPSSGFTVGQFRIWCHGDDTYIADVGVPTWKISLHGEIAWQVAETKESFTSSTPRLNGPDRAPWKFTPPAFVDGRRLAFVIAATRGSLGREVAPERYETVAVRDRWDELTKVNIWMTLPGSPIPEQSDRIGQILELACGNRVWATLGSEPMEGIAPEPAPVSSILEPKVPGIHAVTAPGLLIRGVHLADPRTSAPAEQPLAARPSGPEGVLRGAIDLNAWLDHAPTVEP